LSFCCMIVGPVTVSAIIYSYYELAKGVTKVPEPNNCAST